MKRSGSANSYMPDNYNLDKSPIYDNNQNRQNINVETKLSQRINETPHRKHNKTYNPQVHLFKNQKNNSTTQREEVKGLLSNLKSEINDISNSMKTTDNRVEKYLRNSMKDSRLTINDVKHRNKIFNQINQKKQSISLVKKERQPNSFRELLISPKESKTESFNHELYSQYEDLSKKCSQTYQYERQQFKSPQSSNSNQDTDRRMTQLVQKASFFKKQWEEAIEDRNRLENKLMLLEMEFKETKTFLLEEIENKAKEAALLNTHEQCEKDIDDYINQLDAKEKELRDKDSEIRNNLLDYQHSLQQLLDERDILKKKSKGEDSNVLEITRLNDNLSIRDYEIEQAKEQIEAQKKQIYDLKSIKEYEIDKLKRQLDNQQKEYNDKIVLSKYEIEKQNKELIQKFESEKNELLSKIVQLSRQETDSTQDLINQSAQLKIDNKVLNKEISKLKKYIELNSSEEKFNKLKTEYNTKYNCKVKELKDIKELYNTILAEYTSYQITMTKKVQEYTNEIKDEEQASINNKLSLDLEFKEKEMKILSDQLKNKDSKIEILISEKELIKSQKEAIEKQKEELKERVTKLQYDNEELQTNINIRNKLPQGIITEMNDYTDVYQHRINPVDKSIRLHPNPPLETLTFKETKNSDEEEKNQMKTMIEKLQSEILLYQTQFKEASELNDQNIEQMQNEFKSINNELNTTKSLLLKSNKLNNDLQAETNKLKKQPNNLQKPVNNIEDNLASTLPETWKSKESEVEQLKDKVTQLEYENSRLISVNALSKERHSPQIDFKDSLLESQIEEMKQEKSNLVIEKEKAMNQIKSLQVSHDKLLLEMKFLSNQSSKTYDELQSALTKINQQNQAINKLQTELVSGKVNDKPIANSTKSIVESQLLEEKEVLLKELKALKEELQSLKENPENDIERQMNSLMKEKDQLITVLTEENRQLLIEVSMSKNNEAQLHKMKSNSLFNSHSDHNKDTLFSQTMEDKEDKDKIIASLTGENRTLMIEASMNKKANLENQSCSSSRNKKDLNNNGLFSQISEDKDDKDKIISLLTEENRALLIEVSMYKKQSLNQKAIEDKCIDTILSKGAEDKNKLIASLTEDNRLLLIEVSMNKSFEIQIQKLKAENQSILAQLKSQIDHNKDLLSQLEIKTEEIEQLNNQLMNLRQPSNILARYLDVSPDDIILHDGNLTNNNQSLQKEIKEKNEAINMILKEKEDLEKVLIEKNRIIENMSRKSSEGNIYKQVDGELQLTMSNVKGSPSEQNQESGNKKLEYLYATYI